MAKKTEKIQVRAHERTLADGTQVPVAGYERMKSTPEQRQRHPGNIDTMAAGENNRGGKIITRNPDKHGTVQDRRGKVQIVGRNVNAGVNRVGR